MFNFFLKDIKLDKPDKDGIDLLKIISKENKSTGKNWLLRRKNQVKHD